MPLLEVLTRTNGRPHMLARNQASLRLQTDSDWAQTLLIDDVGRGVPWANEQLAAQADRLVGDYIWVLDDDDRCICPSLVARLRAVVEMERPDVVMVRMDHGPALGVLPDARGWGHAPVRGRIGMSAFIVQRDVWRAHAHAFTPGRLQGDYEFIRAIWDSAPRVVWYDIVASRVQRISRGQRGD